MATFIFFFVPLAHFKSCLDEHDTNCSTLSEDQRIAYTVLLSM